MTNINVRIVGSAQLGGMTKEFAALQGQVAALNLQLAQMVDMNQAVDPRGYERLTRAAAKNSDTFRKAAASTGMFEVQQVRLNSASDEYVKKLNAQKMGFRELMRTRTIAHEAYRKQLAQESMLLRRAPSGTTSNKDVFDVITPKRYSAELDTAGRKLSWMNAQLKSGANQMVNWGKNTQWAGRQLMVGFTMPVLAFGAAAGVMAYQIDKEMTRVRKVYDTTADSTSGRMEDLIAVNKELEQVTRDSMDTAIAAAKAYGQAGTDTIAVQAELAATGKTGLELQRNTMEVMRIARLGEVEYQVATEATIALQSIFRMSNEELTESFNYMNAVENATSLSTKDFAEAIPIAASAVKTWGGDVKELGILLTAMKENGIGASEGANAIKATLQRLARPSKQVREEWQAITGTDITKIVDNAESLSEVFTQIFDATSQLDPSEQRKAFAGLFGSYQVSRMMALTKGMGELRDGVGQVSAAYELAGKAPEEWSQIAENEIEQYRKSISGQFQTALNTLKLQLSTMGQPFVEAATTALSAISKLIEGFNNLPDFGKKIIAGAVVIAALAGPLVMITGLLGNLFGNGLKVFASMLSVMGKFGASLNILSQENAIALKAAEMAEKGYMSQTKAVRGLTIEIEKLVAAQKVATEQTIADAAAMPNTTRKSKSLLAREKREAAHARKIEHMNRWAMLDTSKQGWNYYDDNGKRLNAVEVERRAYASMSAEKAAIAKASAETAASTEKTKRNLTGAAIAGHALAAGMLLTMTNSNETANEIGNMLILGSLVVPSAIQLATLFAAHYKSIRLSVVASTALAAKQKLVAFYTGLAGGAQMRFTKATGAANLAAAAGAGRIASMGAGIAAFANPIGLIAGAVAAVGVGIWAWKKHTEAVRAEQAKLHKDLNAMTDTWAEKMGLVKKEYKELAGIQRGMAEQSRYDKMVQTYESGEFKDEREAFTGDDLSEAEKWSVVLDHFASLQADYGLTTQQAAENIRAFFEAAGMGALAAEAAVEKLMAEVGKVNMGYGEQLSIQANVYWNKERLTEESKDAATDVGEAFSQEFASAAAGNQSQAIIDTLRNIVNEGWTGAWENIAKSSDSSLRTALESIGVNTAEELRDAIGKAGGTENLIYELFPDAQGGEAALFYNQLEMAIGGATQAEAELVSQVAKFMPGVDENIATLYDLENAVGGLVVQAKALPTSKVKDMIDVLASPRPAAMINSILPGLTGIEKAVYGASEAEELGIANAILLSHGLGQAETMAEAVELAAGGIAPEIGRAASEARQLAAGMSAVRAALGSIGQDAMAATQQTIADQYGDYMNDKFDSQLENTQNYWDKRVEQVGNAGERARAALDNAWEKRTDAAEKYWDNRIEMVDKAIEAEEKAEEKREKMFDAEVARIEKLNDLANANIDFNVALNEGKLDEAAKLRNDAQAQADSEAIDRARGIMGTKSERRIDKLNNRKDALEEQRDAAMDALKKQEEAQKASLDRQVEANREAVEQQRDDAIAAKEAQIEAQKKALEEEIKMFMNGTAKSKSELIQRMKDAGLNYKDFFKDVIKPTGTKWGQYFDDELRRNLKLFAEKVQNDAMWEEMGKSSIAQMARGMGFSGQQGLMHFLKTGEIKNFHEDTPAKPGTGTGSERRPEGTGFGADETSHTGGMLGKNEGSRKGVARTYKGIHPSELLVNAQKGEFMVNKKAAAANEPLLRAINDGIYHGPKYGVGGAGQGPAPFFAAALTRGIAKKTAEKLSEAVTTKQSQMAAASAAFASGNSSYGVAGNYSLGAVLPWVQEAANYLGGKFGISSVLGVGERAANSTSDHPKGLALDFMTGAEVSKGWDLANEALRLQSVLDATYMIFQGKIHSFDDRGWQAYSHPSGATDPTSMHMDHVHISFAGMGKVGDLPQLSSGTGSSYVPGAGGRHRPVATGSYGGLHYNNAVDIGVGVGTPVHAIADGRVSGSYDIPGYEPRAAHGGLGYRSYGRVITMDHGGFSSLYGHLSSRAVSAGQTLKGGSRIGLSGNTGNSSGPHLHFGVTGAASPYDFLSLNKGAAEVKFDNTVANLHKGEAVLTRDLNEKFHRGVEQFANGRGVGDTVNVYPSEGMDEERLANKVVRKIARKNSRRPTTRTVGR